MPFEPEFRFKNTDLPVTSNFLGGERSILLSYRDIYSIFGLFPGFLELQPVLRRLRRAVLLIKKRSIFDRFISSIRIIDPSAIIRREVGTVASGAISQDDLNSQQNYRFSAFQILSDTTL